MLCKDSVFFLFYKKNRYLCTQEIKKKVHIMFRILCIDGGGMRGVEQLFNACWLEKFGF